MNSKNKLVIIFYVWVSILWGSNHALAQLPGVYDITRYTESEGGQTTIDTDYGSNLVGTAVVLLDEVIGVTSLDISGQRFVVTIHNYYTENGNTLEFSSYLSGTDYAGTYSWNGLSLTITGEIEVDNVTVTYTYYLLKRNNLDILGPTEDKTVWDVNENGIVDLPDTINSLKILSGQ